MVKLLAAAWRRKPGLRAELTDCSMGGEFVVWPIG
jgi:hypothetical protein